jgi:hypothetical protein
MLPETAGSCHRHASGRIKGPWYAVRAIMSRGGALEQIARVTGREQELLARRSDGYAGEVTQLPDKLAAIRAAAAAFRAEGVAYALIGGLAVGVRSGVARATLDVDFAVPTAADRTRIVARFLAHGFRLKGQFPHSLNFEHDSGEPVQLASDPAFDPMVARAEVLSLSGLDLPVVTTADLIAMKRRAASDPARRRSKALRDQADIALLEGDVGDPDEGW